MKILKVWRWGAYARRLSRRWSPQICGHDALKKRGVPMELSWMTWREVDLAHRLGIKKKARLRAEYERRVSTVDLGETYVYVPLHYQPERTTSSEGGDYTHQLLMVTLLHDLLPEGWYLFVREHPSQFVRALVGEQGRLEVFYRDLADLPAVRLVGHDVSPFDLTDSSCAVATVTGTAGWESIVRGRPALVFGNAWYLPCEGAFRVRSADDLREAYRRLVRGVDVDSRKVVAFLESLHSVARRADTDQAGIGRSPDISPEGNVAGLVGILEDAMSRLRPAVGDDKRR